MLVVLKLLMSRRVPKRIVIELGRLVSLSGCAGRAAVLDGQELVVELAKSISRVN